MNPRREVTPTKQRSKEAKKQRSKEAKKRWKARNLVDELVAHETHDANAQESRVPGACRPSLTERAELEGQQRNDARDGQLQQGLRSRTCTLTAHRDGHLTSCVEYENIVGRRLLENNVNLYSTFHTTFHYYIFILLQR